MKKVQAWIAAARLRTLPLSVSGVIVGSAFGNSAFVTPYDFNYPFAGFATKPLWESLIFWLAILVTIGFQILSNFANDYGDGIKGTDANRKGEKRMVASGMITPKQMRAGMFVVGSITFVLATLLIFMAFGYDSLFTAFIFFNLAIASIIAAIKYTVGKKAYGYSGLGDVFVFLFFGLLSLLGSYYLFTKELQWELLLPATAIGCFSTAVLNLNNLRDIENDAEVGKRTLVVKIGFENAKHYHAFLLVFGILCALSYSLIHFWDTMQFIYAIAFIPLILNIKTVFKNKEPRLLDSELKKVALSTFFFAILFAIFN